MGCRNAASARRPPAEPSACAPREHLPIHLSAGSGESSCGGSPWSVAGDRSSYSPTSRLAIWIPERRGLMYLMRLPAPGRRSALSPTIHAMRVTHSGAFICSLQVIEGQSRTWQRCGGSATFATPDPSTRPSGGSDQFRRESLAVAAMAVAATGCEVHAQSFGVDGSSIGTLLVDGPVELDVLSRSGPHPREGRAGRQRGARRRSIRPTGR